MKGIRISEKHGVNPTIPVCAWCGKKKNEIALLGKLKGDIEAPRNVILDYEPCDKCKEQWSKGVVIIEVSKIPMKNEQFAIAKDAYPTGRIAVVPVEAMIGEFSVGDRTLALVEDFNKIFGSWDKEEEEC